MRARRRGRTAFCCAVAVLEFLAAPARGDEAPPAEPAAEAPAEPGVEPAEPAEPAATDDGAGAAESEPAAWRELGAKTFDAVILRPLGAGATVGGVGAFVLMLPLAWYAEGFDTVWDQFVREPVDYTFQRPLGDF